MPIWIKSSMRKFLSVLIVISFLSISHQLSNKDTIEDNNLLVDSEQINLIQYRYTRELSSI